MGTEARLATGKRTRDGKGGEALLYVVALLFCVPVLFSDILGNDIKIYLFSAGYVLAFFMFLRHREFDLRYFGIGFGWLVFAAVALVSRYTTGGTMTFSQCAFFLAAAAACLGACSTRWLMVMVRCVLALLCVHLAATVFFWIQPSAYSAFKMMFFASKTTAVGYQSGLTSHYSNNGFLLAFGSILCAGFFCGSEKNRRTRWFVLAALFFVGVGLTQKRAHLLLCLFSFVCLFAATDTRGKFTKGIVAIITASIAFGFLVTYVPAIADSFSRLVNTFNTFDSGDVAEATSGRTLLWEVAIREWLQSPFVGNGWGSFSYVWPSGTISIYAHNEFLQLLHDSGIAGLTVFVLLAVPTFLLSIMNVRWAQMDPRGCAYKPIAYFAFAFQVFLISYACTSGILLQSALVCAPWMLTIAIGLSLNYERRSK